MKLFSTTNIPSLLILLETSCPESTLQIGLCSSTHNSKVDGWVNLRWIFTSYFNQCGDHQVHSSAYSIQIQLGHNNFPHETPTFHLDVLEWLNPHVDFSMCATSRNLTYRSGNWMPNWHYNWFWQHKQDEAWPQILHYPRPRGRIFGMS